MQSTATQNTLSAEQLAEAAKAAQYFLQRGQLQAAAKCCRQLRDHAPEKAESWYLSAHTSSRLKNVIAAQDYAQKALSLAPKAMNYRLYYAKLLIASNRISDTAEVMQSINEKDLKDQAQLIAGLEIYSRLQAHDKALYCVDTALGLEPDNGDLLYNRASLLRFLGRLEEAEQCADAILGNKPDEFELIAMRSSLRKQTQDNNHIEFLQKSLKRYDAEPRGRMHIAYALAKEFEDLGDYTASFNALSIGANTKRQHMSYQVEPDIETMLAIRRHYTAELLQSKPTGNSSHRPIFILGLPRSGSTLLERILGGHSKIKSAGELNDFPAALVNACQAEPSISRSQLVEISTRLDWAQLGQSYLDRTDIHTDHSPYLIDKLPLNFLYSGLIHLALPNAKIIHIKRNPMDSCYAMYKQLFKDAYPFSYEFNDLANYYIAYDHLMQHWNDCMPGKILEIQYEDLVATPEQTLRSACEFIGIDVELECLSFQDNKTASTTASAAQIRQPLYQSSVQKWRHFEEQLAPLAQKLTAAGIDI